MAKRSQLVARRQDELLPANRGSLEDAEDYAAFEMAVTADYDAETTVQRELVLRLAGLLWRLRRATAIEAGLFEIQARQILQFRQRRQAHQERQRIIESLSRNAAVTEDDAGLSSTVAPADHSDDLKRAFIRLNNVPTCPLDRLSRYEATLWRQACQILWTLQCPERRKPWRFG